MKMNIKINEVSETAFLTLQCHAMDARSKNPFLNDKSSIRTLNVLKKQLVESNTILHQK